MPITWILLKLITTPASPGSKPHPLGAQVCLHLTLSQKANQHLAYLQT